MKRCEARSLLRHLTLAAFTVLFLGTPVFAQVLIKSAVAQPTRDNPNHWQISVILSESFVVPNTSVEEFEDPSKNPAKNPANYYLLDVKNGERINVVHVDLGLFSRVAANPPFAAVLFVDPSVRLSEDRLYHLYVIGPSYIGVATTPPPQAAVQFPKAGMIAIVDRNNSGDLTTTSGPAGSAEDEKKDEAVIGDSVSFTAADGREDANIYLNGEVTGGNGKKFSGSADIKVEYPYRRILGSRIHNFNFFFDLKASTAVDADPDSMNFGLNWEFPIWRYDGDNLQAPIRRIIWRNAPKIEAERDFDNSNFIWESRFRFMSRTYTAKHATLYFRPFLGQELGKNLRSPVLEARDRFLYRLLGGTTLNLIFPLHAPGIDDVSFETSYIRRWLLRKEVSFEEDDDGNLQALRIGTSPRDHVEVKFNVNFSKSFGSTISYEYGSLPPSFKLVDHKTSIGLTYKIKLN